MIDIRDIAHALAQIPRFGGHLSRPWTVADHCIHMANGHYLRHRNPRIALQLLLHDAAEAYIGDIVSPLKRLLVLEDFTPISAVEDRILTVIGVALGVELLPFDPAVKLWDRRMLKYERNPSFELEPRYSAETAYICCFKSWKQECSQVPVAGELASREEHLR